MEKMGGVKFWMSDALSLGRTKRGDKVRILVRCNVGGGQTVSWSIDLVRLRTVSKGSCKGKPSNLIRRKLL